MPQARDEAGNVWEVDAEGNPVRLLQAAQQRTPQPIVIGEPSPAAPYEGPKAAADLANTQGTIADRAADNQRADTALEGDLYAKGLRIGANGQIEPIPGWVKPGQQHGALTAEMRGSALNQYGTLANLAVGVNDLRQQFRDNFEGRNPLEGAGAYVPFIREQDRVFNDRSGSLTAFIATALGLTGQQFNTPAEQKLFIQSILPTAGDTDGQIQAKLDTMEELIGSARTKGRAMLGFTDEDDPLLADPRFKEFLNRKGGGNVTDGPAPPKAAAGFGATEQSIPIDPAYQAEYEGFVRSGDWTPEQYAAKRAELDQRFNYAATADYLAEGQRIRETLDKGGQLNLTIPPSNEELSGLDRMRNDMVSNPLGAAGAGYFNAAMIGVPGLLADDGQMEALRDANPVSSTIGEIAGGITGSLGAGAAIGIGAKALGGSGIAKLLANPMAGDAAYGGVYGATQADDPLTGGATGVVSALVGSAAGSQIAKRIPGAVGARKPADELSAGERRVFNAASSGEGGVDPVLAALSQAGDLGVPASPADVSPEVGSLTGAALRRSPAAAGAARQTLGQRSRGQYDRFLRAVERDLGPIENVPQRSEDLINQARSAAGPLYDQAYGAPGASVIGLTDLMARPSMSRALANARRIALEEGRDPAQLGIIIDDAGHATMTAQPSWQTLDYVKRGLDDVLEGYRDKTTGRLVLDTEGKAVNDTLRTFLSRVDEMNPDYAAARAAYAGPAAEREAMQRGQQAFRMSPDQLAVNVGRASPSQVDQMRLGFQSQIAENAGRLRNSSNPFGTLDNPAMEARLGTMYDGDANIARLLAQRDLEGQIAGSTNRLVGNSLTAERQVADEAFGQQGLMGDIVQGAAETAITGAPVATALRSGAGRGLGGTLRDWRTLGVGRRATELADEIAPIALNTDPAAATAQILDMKERAMAYDAVLKALVDQASGRGAHIGGGASSVIAAELMR